MPMTFTWTLHLGKDHEFTVMFQVRVSENRHPGR